MKVPFHFSNNTLGRNHNWKVGVCCPGGTIQTLDRQDTRSWLLSYISPLPLCCLSLRKNLREILYLPWHHPQTGFGKSLSSVLRIRTLPLPFPLHSKSIFNLPFVSLAKDGPPLFSPFFSVSTEGRGKK